MNKKPQMFTSNFYHYSGAGRISIARGAPRGMSGFRIYRKLNPGSWFHDKEFSNNEARFRDKFYSTVLSNLNPHQVWEDLHKLVSGQEHPPVLLCHENLSQKGQWCHRRMVAEWLEAELKVLVPEWQPEPKPMPLFEM